MTDHFGRFGWYDLMTPEPAAAVEFYGSVVGFGTQVWGGAGKPYTMWLSGEQPVTVDQTNRSVVVGGEVVVKWLVPPVPAPHPGSPKESDP